MDKVQNMPEKNDTKPHENLCCVIFDKINIKIYNNKLLLIFSTIQNSLIN